MRPEVGIEERRDVCGIVRAHVGARRPVRHTRIGRVKSKAGCQVHRIEGPDDARLGDLDTGALGLTRAFHLDQDFMLEVCRATPRDTFDTTSEGFGTDKTVELEYGVAHLLFGRRWAGTEVISTPSI